MTLRRIWRALTEFVRKYDDTHNFTCDICGREVFDNERVCQKCREKLPWNDEIFCPLCGRKQLEAGICLDCKQKPPEYDLARSCFVHEGEAAMLMLKFKRGAKYLYRTACDFLQPLLEREFPDAEALTFVPMTACAEKKRGYNQSRLMAEELARRCGKQLLDVTEKRRDTDEQKTLGREERAKNLEGCFHVFDRKAVKGRQIVIVDDIMTTGATVGELASVLFRAGARSVYVLSVTSAINKKQFGILPDKRKKIKPNDLF